MKEREGVAAYPLSWPAGWERTKEPRWSKFARGSKCEPLTVFRGAQEVLEELERLGARNPIISTNMRTRKDGIPLSGQKNPADAGVAVYFDFAGKPTVLACDRWKTVEENLRAIARHIEAMRGMDRWGVGNLAQAFAGFAALPGSIAGRSWREVLGVSADLKVSSLLVTSVYRELARIHHPDHGGSVEAMAELNRAREQALEEIGADA